MEPVLIIPLMIVLVVGFRLLAGSMDKGRIEAYIRSRGWELLDKSWDPFGPGWFGGKDSRIYQVVYRDQQGQTHRAHVKTSMLSGVYLTNDEIVSRAVPARSVRPLDREETEVELRREVERLRQRVEELEGN